MKKINYWATAILMIIVGALLNTSCSNTPTQTITTQNITCEFLENPVGIETPSPRFAWEMNSEINGELQTAYRIIVSDSKEAIDANKGTMWDSHKTTSSKSNNVEYTGKSFDPGKKYWWKVKVWNANKKEQVWSETASFETGLLAVSDWQNARWIGLANDNRPKAFTGRLRRARDITKPKVLKTAHPAPLFRKSLNITKNIKSVRAYVSGLGYNEFYINGKMVGENVLRPGQTSYDKRAYYEIYDIASYLNMGENTFAFMLGNGFYGQNLALGAGSLNYGKPRLKCMMHITYEDGSSEHVITDKSWLGNTGPIVFDNVYAGETYDARLEIKDWNKNGCDTSTWSNAIELSDDEVPVLTAQLLEPIRKIKYIKPVNFYQTKTGSAIYDCGENIAGWAKIRVNEPSGTKITLKFAEILSEDGQAIDPSTTGPQATGYTQTEIYICKGTGEEVWEPRFTYHGFRYVEIDGLSDPKLNSVEMCFVRNDVEKAGTFSCSDELLNDIYDISLRTIEGNLHNTPEDCPHREKCGWMGDAHTSVEVMNYNYNMRQMWSKFMKDIETTLGTGIRTHEGLKASPGIPTNIALGKRTCLQARPDWGAAIILIPWWNYVFYNNTRMISENFEHMARWMDYQTQYLEDGIMPIGYGDWCHIGWKGRDSIPTPKALTSTAYYYHSLQLMAKMARLMNKPNQAKEYKTEAVIIKKAFNKKFLNEKLMTYGSQTANAVALDMGLVPEGKETAVVKSLALLELEEKENGHFTTGVHGTKRLFTQLSKFGYDDAVFKLFRNEDYPSYKYLIDHNFTTWPEAFRNYEKEVNALGNGSHNHPMNAAFSMWYHQYAGGIKPDENSPGFKHFTIKPFGYNHLEFINSSYLSAFGEIVSNWKVNGNQFTQVLTIPVNSTATVFVPASSEKKVEVIQNQKGVDENIKFKAYEDGFACYELASGNYNIKSSL